MNIAKKVLNEGYLKKPYFINNVTKNNAKLETTQIKNDEVDDAYLINGFDVILQTRGFDIEKMTSEYFTNRNLNLRDLPRLVGRYREVANQSYVDEAIDIIIEEMIFGDTDGTIVYLDLSDFVTNFKNNELADKIHDKWNKILELMDFNENAYQFVRDWYIDGRICFECVYNIKNDKITKDGIEKILQVDPIFVEKYFEIDTKKEIYKVKRLDFSSFGVNRMAYVDLQSNLYGHNGVIEEILTDERMLVYTDSGLFDKVRGIHLSYLHRILKPINQLKTLEDSILIYRLARAPERRVFFVDVGKATKSKAENYIKEIQRDLSQKSIVNEDGTMDSSKAIHNIMEDYWIPRRNGSNATDVSTMQGQNNLGELGDLSYFLNKVYKSLRIPKSRMNDDGGGTYFYGNEGDISQEEVRFFKFIQRLRNKFKRVFLNLLKNELITCGILDESDWKKYRSYFKINFTQNSYYNELMENSVLDGRIEMAKKIIGDDVTMVNKYYPEDWIWTKIFKYSDEDIREIKKLIKDKNVDLKDVEDEENSELSLSDDDMSGLNSGGSGSNSSEFSDEEFSDEEGEMSDEEFSDEIEDSGDIDDLDTEETEDEE